MFGHSHRDRGKLDSQKICQCGDRDHYRDYDDSRTGDLPINCSKRLAIALKITARMAAISQGHKDVLGKNRGPRRLLRYRGGDAPAPKGKLSWSSSPGCDREGEISGFSADDILPWRKNGGDGIGGIQKTNAAFYTLLFLQLWASLVVTAVRLPPCAAVGRTSGGQISEKARRPPHHVTHRAVENIETPVAPPEPLDAVRGQSRTRRGRESVSQSAWQKQRQQRQSHADGERAPVQRLTSQAGGVSALSKSPAPRAMAFRVSISRMLQGRSVHRFDSNRA